MNQASPFPQGWAGSVFFLDVLPPDNEPIGFGARWCRTSGVPERTRTGGGSRWRVAPRCPNFGPPKYTKVHQAKYGGSADAPLPAWSGAEVPEVTEFLWFPLAAAAPTEPTPSSASCTGTEPGRSPSFASHAMRRPGRFVGWRFRWWPE